MEFNMVCVKFDQKSKKNLNFGLMGFFGFFLNPRFFRSHFPFQPWSS